jgi:hypothetical protein
MYPVFIHCYMDLVGKGHTQEGTCQYSKLDVLSIFFTFGIRFLETVTYATVGNNTSLVFQLEPSLTASAKIMRWYTYGIFRSLKACFLHLI